MILHLGKNHIIPKKDIFFICKYTKEFYEANEEYFEEFRKKGAVVEIDREKPIKAVISGRVMRKDYVFFSPIAVSTLLKRMNEE